MSLDQADRHRLSEHLCCPVEGLERHGIVIGIQQAIHLGSARAKAPCKLALAGGALLELLPDLPGQHRFCRLAVDFLADALLIQEIIEAAAVGPGIVQIASAVLRSTHSSIPFAPYVLNRSRTGSFPAADR